MSTRRKPRIGEVAVWKGTPPDNNPHDWNGRAGGSSLIGPERARVLRAFMEGEDTTGFTLWAVPYTGPSYRIESAEGINWCDLNTEE